MTIYYNLAYNILMLNIKENKKMKHKMSTDEAYRKLFINAYEMFLNKVAKAHNISLQKLINMSNNDDEIRQELEAKFSQMIKAGVAQ